MPFSTDFTFDYTFQVTDETGPDLTGTEFNDRFIGDSGNNMFWGLGGRDLFSPGLGLDQMTGGPGGDIFSGSVADFEGDVITDFAQEDAIEIVENGFLPANYGKTFGNDFVTLGADGNNDGTVSSDEGLTLSGDYTVGNFSFGFNGTYPVVTFENAFPSISEGQELNEAARNGTNNPFFLTGNGVNDFKVTLDERTTGAFSNTLGYYEIDEDGNILDAGIAFANANEGEAEMLISDVESGNMLGFFIVQDAGLTFGVLADDDTFAFTNSDGDAGNVSDASDLWLTVNGDVVEGHIFHSYDASLNADGVEHVASGANADGSATFGFEDLTGGGDNDFNDVVFQVSLDISF